MKPIEDKKFIDLYNKHNYYELMYILEAYAYEISAKAKELGLPRKKKGRPNQQYEFLED